MTHDFDKALATASKWVVGYRDAVADLPVLTNVTPGDIYHALPEQAPVLPQPFDDMMADFRNIIMPGITHWQHPNFMAYFPSQSSPPSVIAELLIAGLGVQGMSWLTSPAATELEQRMMEWLRAFLNLPKHFTGVIQDSASTSTLTAMIVAREQHFDFRCKETGLAPGVKLTAYCSEEAHSSVEKAAMLLGIGRQYLRKIPTGADLSMRVDLLESAINQDLQAGLTPFFIVAAFGTTSTTAIDPLAAIADVAARHGLWLHVDAAYAGAAFAIPRIRALANGLERADSLVINAHKWLLTTFDCSAMFIKRPDLLTRAMSVERDYLQTDVDHSVVNFRDWGIGLGRRFRSLKLWFVLRWYGTAAMTSLMEKQIDAATAFAVLLAADPRFTVWPHHPVNLICFRLVAGSECTKALMDALNQTGKVFLSHTTIRGEFYIRAVFAQPICDMLLPQQVYDLVTAVLPR